jgi:Protein O-mannosyl-transferase TMEM260-like
MNHPPSGRPPGGVVRGLSRRIRPAVRLAALLAPLVVYLLTLAREVTAIDSGELVAAAATLGIAHPPGYPLFTLLGWALAHLVPVGTVVFRVGLLSAVPAALTALVIHRTSMLAVATARANPPPRPPPRPPPERGPAVAVAALGGALLFAFARTPWSQAVVVEVYALQALLVMLFLLACARALRPGADPARAWPAAGLAAGLALANHLTAVLLLPGLVATVLLGIRSTRGRFRAAIGKASVALLLPLLLYAYLPLRSLAAPAVCWNPIDSVQAFLVHVTARQYHGLWGSQGLRLGELARFLTRQLPSEATPLLVVLAAVGLVALVRSWPPFALVTALTLVLLVVYNLGYPIHDIELYYIPVLAIVGLWAAFGAAILARAASRLHYRAAAAVAAVLCLASLLPLIRNWHYNDRHDSGLIACAVRDTLTPLAPDSVLFTSRWDTLTSPALYAQWVTGLRPDVLILDYGQLASPSLGAKLERLAPDLAQACAAELAAVRETGRRAERGQAYAAAAGRAQLARLRRALLAAAVRLRPTSVTSDLYDHPMVAGYRLVPEGLVARVETRDVLRPFPPDALRGPCARRQDLRGPLEKLVWDDYRVAFLNRAQALRDHGFEAEAAAFARRAAQLDR